MSSEMSLIKLLGELTNAKLKPSVMATLDTSVDAIKEISNVIDVPETPFKDTTAGALLRADVDLHPDKNEVEDTKNVPSTKNEGTGSIVNEFIGINDSQEELTGEWKKEDEVRDIDENKDGDNVMGKSGKKVGGEVKNKNGKEVEGLEKYKDQDEVKKLDGKKVGGEVKNRNGKEVRGLEKYKDQDEVKKLDGKKVGGEVKNRNGKEVRGLEKYKDQDEVKKLDGKKVGGEVKNRNGSKKVNKDEFKQNKKKKGKVENILSRCPYSKNKDGGTEENEETDSNTNQWIKSLTPGYLMILYYLLFSIQLSCCFIGRVICGCVMKFKIPFLILFGCNFTFCPAGGASIELIATLQTDIGGTVNYSFLFPDTCRYLKIYKGNDTNLNDMTCYNDKSGSTGHCLLGGVTSSRKNGNVTLSFKNLTRKDNSLYTIYSRSNLGCKVDIPIQIIVSEPEATTTTKTVSTAIPSSAADVHGNWKILTAFIILIIWLQHAY